MNIQVVHDQYQVLINGWPLTEIIALISIGGLLIGWWLSASARKESARANTLQSLPILTFHTNLSRGEIGIQNIGSSPATAIKVDPYYHPMYDNIIEHKGKILSLKFLEMPLILKDEIKGLEVNGKVGGIIDIPWLVQIMINSEIPLIFNIRYSDVTGKKYFTRLKILKSTITIITSPRKYTIFRRLWYVGFRIKEQIILNTRARYHLLKMHLQAKKDNTPQTQ